MRLADAPACSRGPARWAESPAILALMERVSDSQLPDDPDCSPHPLDVLAICALYQQESSP